MSEISSHREHQPEYDPRAHDLDAYRHGAALSLPRITRPLRDAALSACGRLFTSESTHDDKSFWAAAAPGFAMAMAVAAVGGTVSYATEPVTIKREFEDRQKSIPGCPQVTSVDVRGHMVPGPTEVVATDPHDISLQAVWTVSKPGGPLSKEYAFELQSTPDTQQFIDSRSRPADTPD
jgi:hypothetical protein